MESCRLRQAIHASRNLLSQRVQRFLSMNQQTNAVANRLRSPCYPGPVEALASNDGRHLLTFEDKRDVKFCQTIGGCLDVGRMALDRGETRSIHGLSGRSSHSRSSVCAFQARLAVVPKIPLIAVCQMRGVRITAERCRANLSRAERECSAPPRRRFARSLHSRRASQRAPLAATATPSFPIPRWQN